MFVYKEVLVESFLLVKESLWLYILCFKVPSVAPMYCLSELGFFLPWLCTLRFSVSSFLAGACFVIATVVLFVGVCFAVNGFNLFVVAFYDLRYVTCTTLADLYIVSVENFSVGAMIGKVLAYKI